MRLRCLFRIIKDHTDWLLILFMNKQAASAHSLTLWELTRLTRLCSSKQATCHLCAQLCTNTERIWGLCTQTKQRTVLKGRSKLHLSYVAPDSRDLHSWECAFNPGVSSMFVHRAKTKLVNRGRAAAQCRTSFSFTNINCHCYDWVGRAVRPS